MRLFVDTTPLRSRDFRRLWLAGIPTVICGPGDIAQAHQPDEFITVAQLEAGTAFIRKLIAELAR